MNALEIINNAIEEVIRDENTPATISVRHQGFFFVCTSNHPLLYMETTGVNGARMDSGVVGERKVKT